MPAFGLIHYLPYALETIKSNSAGIFSNFYEQFYSLYNPDINGYTLVIMVPPDLSGYRLLYGSNLYGGTSPSDYYGEVSNMMSFLAVDYTPPQSQVNSEQVSTRSGSFAYATEVVETDTCSVTYIETATLDVYLFHHLWVEYIREVVEGSVRPDPAYYTPGTSYYGTIDYAGALYIIKYMPDMSTITYIGKCIGIFPQSLPSKELIGTRTSNELTTLPFTYFCSGYRECTGHETNSKIYQELQFYLSRYRPAVYGGGYFGGIGELLNIGKNFLGNISSSIFSGVKSVINEIISPDTYSYSDYEYAADNLINL